MKLIILDSNNKNKVCYMCNINKAITEFHKCYTKGRQRTHSNYCKDCRKNSYRKSIYNIDNKEYEYFIKKQNYRCAICQTHVSKLKKGLVVDHNHSTGKIRGLLCGNCNMAIGLLKENIEIIHKLETYLLNQD